MARAPSSAGKTRLAPYLSNSRLHALRLALLADTLRVLSSVPGIDLTVFYTPEKTASEIRTICGPRVPLVPQSTGDLGSRMQAAIAHLLDLRGVGAALLVGSDVPLIAGECVAEASALLDGPERVVIGPADDGGYYLIGMRQAHSALFEQISWGSSTTLTETRLAAERAGLEIRLIRSGYDVDTMDDLQRLERDLESAPPDTAAAMRAWFKAA